MANLESKATKTTIVIRKNQVIDIALIQSFCEEHFKRYAFIEHANDLSVNTMEVEGCHYHIVGELKQRTRLNTILNRIVKHFGFDNPFGIELDIAQCIEGCYQYLIHKNDKDKTPHSIEEIVTNIPIGELTTIMEYDIKDTSINADRLYYIISNYVNYRPELGRIVVNYYGIIKDIGAGRCNAISWSLNNLIKHCYIEKALTHHIPIKGEY